MILCRPQFRRLPPQTEQRNGFAETDIPTYLAHLVATSSETTPRHPAATGTLTTVPNFQFPISSYRHPTSPLPRPASPLTRLRLRRSALALGI